jgi:hypothetical protein
VRIGRHLTAPRSPPPVVEGAEGRGTPHVGPLSSASPLLHCVARLVLLRSAGRCTRLCLTLRRAGPSKGRAPREACRRPQESEGAAGHGQRRCISSASEGRRIAERRIHRAARRRAATWVTPAGSHHGQEREGGAKYGDVDSDMWTSLCHVCENHPKTTEGCKSYGFDSL